MQTCTPVGVFQSTPSAWRETITSTQAQLKDVISIHSLRMEGDGGGIKISPRQAIFQSTPSAWRETVRKNVRICRRRVFQSTPSAWRETIDLACGESLPEDFNPLPPHGGRPFDLMRLHLFGDISIHSLRMEGDVSGVLQTGRGNGFQSTPSAWRETVHCTGKSENHAISIHSLRMEGDDRQQASIVYDVAFQSTPSAWRETWEMQRRMPVTVQFQSTPSAWRETTFWIGRFRRTGNFNPLPPHGGRLYTVCTAYSHSFISIHSLRMEGDEDWNEEENWYKAFQSTPSAWRETAAQH